MAQPPLDVATGCGCRTGAIFVRPCQGTPVTACGQCKIALCIAHRRPYGNQVLCPRCYAGLQPSSDSIFDSSGYPIASGSATGYGESPSEEVFAGAGGEFGGGGASGSWSEDQEPAGSDALTESPFSAEDYAAFDAVSDYDRNDEKGGGYDS